MRILVLDVGTSSMRGTLLDEQANVLFQQRIKYQPVFFEDGRVEQSPSDWEEALEALCVAAGEQYPVDALALTAQRSSVIPMSKQGSPLGCAMMWQDGRTAAVCRAMEPETDEIRRICGADPNTVFAAPKMAWFEQNPETQATGYCVIADYLLHCITGKFVMDDTYGSRTLLMDLRNRAWSPELLALFGVRQEQLSQLIPAGSVAGAVTAEFAVRTGLTAGIPVVSCGGDQQCAALGQGVFSNGRAAVNLGTGAYLLLQMDNVPDYLERGLICNTAAVPGAYLLESSVLTCGGALDWMLRELYDGAAPERAEAALARTRPGAGGVIALPYFQGRSSIDWNTAARATFHGISLATTRDDLLRSLIEGICCELGRHLRRMARVQPIEEIRVSGGLSVSGGICQILADVCRRPIYRSERADATTDGAWMSTAMALGLIGRWEDVWSRLDSRGQTFVPCDETAQIYEDLIVRGDALYQRLYGQNEDQKEES